MSAGEFLQELFCLRNRWVHCSFLCSFCVYLSRFVRQANLRTNTHRDEDISSHSWQAWAVSLLCYCSNCRLQMQMTAALSLRINLHLLWRDSDTYPSAKYLQWEASRGTSSAHSQSHAPSVSVSHNLCLSSTQALSLLLLMTDGPWDQANAGPRPPLLALCSTYIDIAISLHTLVCSTKSCWPWEGCMCAWRKMMLREIWKLALSLPVYFIASHYVTSYTESHRQSWQPLIVFAVSSFNQFPAPILIG